MSQSVQRTQWIQPNNVCHIQGSVMSIPSHLQTSWALYIVLPPIQKVIFQKLNTESSTNKWTKQSRFYLTMQTDTISQNVIF